MTHKYLFLIVFLIAPIFGATAQQKVFDVHLHGARDVSSQLASLKDAGVYRIAVSTSWDLQQTYSKQDDLQSMHGLMIPCPNGKVPYSLQTCFEDGREWPSVDWVEGQIKTGNIDFIGEVLAQYHGISSSDSALMPYYRLALKYNIPVGIHTGSAGPDHGCPNFREDMGNPMLMENLLKQLPNLRVWIMHAGAPYHEEAIAIMKRFPNVYTDISAINNPMILGPEIFAGIIQSFISNGLEDRIMFGSDNGDIDSTMKSVVQLSFLTEEQRQKIFYRNAEEFFRRRTH